MDMSSYYSGWVAGLQETHTVWAVLVIMAIVLMLPWPLSERIADLRERWLFRWFHIGWLAVMTVTITIMLGAKL